MALDLQREETIPTYRVAKEEGNLQREAHSIKLFKASREEDSLELEDSDDDSIHIQHMRPSERLTVTERHDYSDVVI
eukprot:CAMPEP_0185585260 /NCGR_PEP_ID=MMETSP0434-20130131/37711_1 /TAXON_ID=626734 ORGANISM="Favella taraikaensis, Strain Fe Narragansett Bay" /NCGR_SAMPLE_ID=MMETSP0434 /ASSEMBLY_ACC=CAM_ASM_000379 /LENGTH=76 /DNA_ID=CAMNT_0028205491 /DNA_START=1279 /DNA_END=1509 /DNA_ORIENTATION=+